MATTEKKKSNLTVKDAARRFNRTTARIRQICIAHEIGEVIENRIRLLSRDNMREIGRIIEENGYEKTSEKTASARNGT